MKQVVLMSTGQKVYKAGYATERGYVCVIIPHGFKTRKGNLAYTVDVRRENVIDNDESYHTRMEFAA